MADERQQRSGGGEQKGGPPGPGGVRRPETGPDPDRDHHRRLQRDRQARVAKALVILALVVLFIVFVAQNLEPTDIDFLWFHFTPGLIWVLLVVGFLGAIVGYLLGRPSRRVRLHERDEEEKRKKR